MISLHQNLKCSKCKELKGISDYEDIVISKKLSMG